MNKDLEEVVGGRIHEVLNNTLHRKLSVGEYARVVEDIGWMIKHNYAAGQAAGRNEAVEYIRTHAAQWGTMEDQHFMQILYEARTNHIEE